MPTNFEKSAATSRIAFYGGSFDPPHRGHLAIARKLTEIFALDEFVFIPAFHAPHKLNRKPTAAFHRYAMLCLATQGDLKLKVSTVELDQPEKPYTVETQAKFNADLPDAEIYFVIGADSWTEITTWQNWETVLTQTNIIVVTRPDYEIEFAHVTQAIQARIVDLRGRDSRFKIQDLWFRVQGSEDESKFQIPNPESRILNSESKIYLTDAVQMDISATEIRRKIREKQTDWRELVPSEVAKYIEKYELYT